jgi:hypothetical protein
MVEAIDACGEHLDGDVPGFGLGDLFQKTATQILQSLWNAPRPLIMGTGQAEKTAVAAEIIFWGCPVKNFKADLPFHGMRQDFAAF